MPPSPPGFILDAARRLAVHHAEHRTALGGFRHDHLERVRGGAEDAADFGNVPEGREHIDGEALPHDDHEKMARADGIMSSMGGFLRRRQARGEG